MFLLLLGQPISTPFDDNPTRLVTRSHSESDDATLGLLYSYNRTTIKLESRSNMTSNMTKPIETTVI